MPHWIPEVWLLEAKLNEDMALLFNVSRSAYLDEENHLGLAGLNIFAIRKAKDALVRATFVSAFQFVESYLNGIAADFVLTTPVDLETLTLLTERLPSGQAKYVNFRDKALKYPKVFLGSEHPPLQESNCEELKLLVEMVRTRDALVHPSSLPQGGWAKEDAFFALTLDDCTNVVDAAVAYVRKVETTIGRNSVILEWVIPRGTDGLFPEKAFA
jgi:hypothetical protein